ncbi:SDR family NAD(P)-dependent oxidoreductase [Mesorhizobium sp. CA8]|uniref:SDR family NAD(P)-dependent oxidoreductase n=1 Tax=Mesorhizobium sp. CA8 TaxID=2876637 RepID=UPI0021E287F1|nr:SDR family NAD(P)-dependent oxidoreductase [Mesorhizobium sp. CA8]
MSQVVVVVGAGSIGQAVARRVSVGKTVLLADLRPENAEAAAKALSDAGYDARTTTVDVSSRGSVEALVAYAAALGEVTGLIQAEGVSPSQAPIEAILEVDLYGTALLLEAFGNVVAKGGSGVVISSQSGHRMAPLTIEQNRQLAITPVDELLDLPFLQRVRCRIRSTPISFPSAAMDCACRRKLCAGADAAPASTRSAPASS